MHVFDQSDLNTKLYGNVSAEEFAVLKLPLSRIKQFWVSRCSHKGVFHNPLLV